MEQDKKDVQRFDPFLPRESGGEADESRQVGRIANRDRIDLEMRAKNE
jgi:hypothetical protein